jgi:hypothetical protein
MAVAAPKWPSPLDLQRPTREWRFGRIWKIIEHEEVLLVPPSEGRCRGCGIGAGTSEFLVMEIARAYLDLFDYLGGRGVKPLGKESRPLYRIRHVHEQHEAWPTGFCPDCDTLLANGWLRITPAGVEWFDPVVPTRWEPVLDGDVPEAR